MIELAMRFGKTPGEFLAATNSAEISELFAYFELMRQEPTKSPSDVEGDLKKLLGKKQR